jgi:hypothetical protein
METFCNALLKKSGRSVNRSLKQNIDTLYTWRLVDISFLRAMHEIRELGNAAAHDHLRLPSRPEAEKRVLHYLEEKKKFEKGICSTSVGVKFSTSAASYGFSR